MNVISHKKIWNILLLSVFVFAVVLTTCNVLIADNAASLGENEVRKNDVRKNDVRKKETKKTTKPKPVTNSIGMKMVLIPAGEFQMGSPNSEKDRHPNEGPQHKVKITKPFYMATTEVTQKQWKAMMGTTPWKGKKNVAEGDHHPATYVNWDDARNFIKKLNKKEGVTYRLPTEAEWEYACRAGTTTPFHFGNICNGEKCTINGTYPYGTTKKGPDWEGARAVGSYAANRFGLHDMHGNVWEWCSDWYGENYYQQFAKKAAMDPSGAVSGSLRVVRGGAWTSRSEAVRSTCRGAAKPSIRYDFMGIRLVRVL